MDCQTSAGKIASHLVSKLATEPLSSETSARADEIIAAVQVSLQEGQKIAENNMLSLFVYLFELMEIHSLEEQQMFLVHMAITTKAIKYLAFQSDDERCCSITTARDIRTLLHSARMWLFASIASTGQRDYSATKQGAFGKVPMVSTSSKGMVKSFSAPAGDPNATIDPATSLASCLESIKLKPKPLSQEQIRQANMVISSLFSVKIDPGKDNAYCFAKQIFDKYQEKKLTSIQDKQLIVVHLTEASVALNTLLFPQGVKCCLCDEYADLKSDCPHGVLFCCCC